MSLFHYYSITSGRNLRIGTNVVTSNLMIEKEQKNYEMTMMGVLINTLATRTVNGIIRSVKIGTAVIIRARRLRTAPLIGFAILLISLMLLLPSHHY